MERIEAFCRWMEDATCTRQEPWRFGTALFNDDFPERYDSNFLRVERPVGSASADEIAADADRLFAAFGHREVVVVDEADGERLAAGFGELGWPVDHLLYLVRRRAPDRPGEADVREAPVDDALVFRREVWRRANGEASVPIAEFVRVLADKAEARFFLSHQDGTAVAGCELYVHDGIAQIEDVNTLEEARGRGLARAVVLAAADEARGRGADPVFLIADAADWPKELYGKLGFDPAGAFWQFTRVPTG
ncbi:MAG: GNAT family N-acetyltransferase [Actinomycetota bacterium]